MPDEFAATQGNGVHHTHTPLRAGLLEAGVRRILIVGAGGFGREVFHWAHDAWPDGTALVGGFLSADPAALDGRDMLAPILAAPDAYDPQPGDALLLAIGIPGVRRRVAEELTARGGRFLSLVHPTAIVARSAVIGTGSILCPGAIVSDGARLGRCVLVNYHASLAHDSAAGDYAVLSPYASLAGGATIGDDSFLGLHASVGPAVTVGPRSKVAANSCALSNVPPDSLMLGVPGRVSPTLS